MKQKTKQFNFGDGSKVFFTSDTHFGHANIIKLCNRPFANADEMNEELIKRWNEKVGKDDYVFHLGDFAFGGSTLWNSILDRLNGHIILILGNHDFKNLRSGYMSRFEDVQQQMYIQIGGKSVYLNHYPYLCFGGSYKNDQSVIQLFGHVHSSPYNTGKDAQRLEHLFPTQYDVGVDNNDFRPISFDEVLEKIKQNSECKNVTLEEDKKSNFVQRMAKWLKEKFDLKRQKGMQ